MEEKYIGVFDSGLGGLSVLSELMKILPNENFLYLGDSKNAPYGEKTRKEVTERCFSIVDFFKNQKCKNTCVKAVVVACNTATSAAIKEMRERADFPIIGIEPALKPACYEKTKQNVIVMATPFTLKEKKFERLMSNYSEKNNIIKLPCPKLVEIIEDGNLDNVELVRKTLSDYLNSIEIEIDEIDSIVLGCTHFIFYRKYIENIISDKTEIIDGNKGTALHLRDVLIEKNIMNKSDKEGSVKIYNTSDDSSLVDLSWELLKKLI